MKHHIYITPEGSINWIEKMPEEPIAKKQGFGLQNMFDYESKLAEYKSDVERVKAESICFDNQNEIRGLLGDYLDPHNKPIIKKDIIYPIELDADIQIVEVQEYPGFDHTSYPTFKKVAKIIPKKAEESDDDLWNEVLTLVRNLDDAEVIFVSLKKHFEIKRKA